MVGMRRERIIRLALWTMQMARPSGIISGVFDRMKSNECCHDGVVMERWLDWYAGGRGGGVCLVVLLGRCRPNLE